jgi:hypothetical protein
MDMGRQESSKKCREEQNHPANRAKSAWQKRKGLLVRQSTPMHSCRCPDFR